MGKSGGYATDNIRRLRRVFVRRWWWVLVLFLLFVVAAFIAVGWFDRLAVRWFDRREVFAFVLGAGIATAIALTARLLGEDGSRSWRDGRMGESITKSLLKRLRRQGWHVVHDVKGDRGNIDHVLLGTQGVIAVETKFRSGELEVCADAPWLTPQLEQARWAASKLRSFLRAGGVVTPVVPLVVLWGARIEGPPVSVHGGVVVLVRPKDRAWLAELQLTPLTEEQVELAMRAINRRKDELWVDHPSGKEPQSPTAEPSDIRARPSLKPKPASQVREVA